MLVINNLNKIVGHYLCKDWVIDECWEGGEMYHLKIKPFNQINHINSLSDGFTIHLERKKLGKDRYYYFAWTWGKDGNSISRMIELKCLKNINVFLKELENVVSKYLNK